MKKSRNIIKNLILWINLLVLLFSITGCGNTPTLFGLTVTEHFSDAYQHQPWAALDHRANARVAVKSDFYGGISWLEWKQKGKFVDSREITSKCVTFLQKVGFWNKPEPIPVPSDSRYPWTNPNAVLDYFRKSRVKQGKAIVGYHKIRTIVCINPVVIVIVGGIIEDWGRTFDYSPEPHADPPLKEVFVVLDHGFAYGTRMPYNPNPEWFSPDLDVTPRPVEMLSETKGRIPVPWGFLILNREADEWVVTTQEK